MTSHLHENNFFPLKCHFVIGFRNFRTQFSETQFNHRRIQYRHSSRIPTYMYQFGVLFGDCSLNGIINRPTRFCLQTQIIYLFIYLFILFIYFFFIIIYCAVKIIFVLFGSQKKTFSLIFLRNKACSSSRFHFHLGRFSNAFKNDRNT